LTSNHLIGLFIPYDIGHHCVWYWRFRLF
jgi:hypothetical protein